MSSDSWEDILQEYQDYLREWQKGLGPILGYERELIVSDVGKLPRTVDALKPLTSGEIVWK